MKNNSITQFLTDGVEEVFNPVIVYEGLYAFDASVLSQVGKIEKGVNLFDAWMEKRFYKEIKNCFGKLIFTDNPRLILFSDLDGNYGRNLKVSTGLFLSEMALNIIGEPVDLPIETDDYRTLLVEYFRDYRKKLNNIMNNTMDEESKRVHGILYDNYLRNENNRKIALGKNYHPFSYLHYLEVIKEYISSFLVGLRRVIPFLDKPLELNELNDVLDLDKFFLAMVKQLVEVSKETIKQCGKIHNSFVFIEKYIIAVNELRNSGKYELSIKTNLLDGNPFTYTVDDAIREYNELKIACPDFRIYSFENDGRDYRNLDTAREFTTELEEYIESKQLEASWEFIKNGRREVAPLHSDSVERLKTKVYDKRKVTVEESKLAIKDRMDFLNRTNYLYQMTGKNNFEGYIGYIYANGVVLFEKFYKQRDSYEPAMSNATYVMTFNNFVEMSMLTKTDIMEYIKQGGTDVRRVYHTSTWCDRIIQVIDGKAYDEKAVDKIDRLLSEGKISKLNK